MKKIYFLHGYQTSGKKFECIKDFYKDSKEYLPINWEWDEFMDIPKFIADKIKIIKEDTGEKILMADSMGANLAWHIVNEIPDLHYVMTNPVFSAEQIVEQEKILPEMRDKIFSATPETIKNKNIQLIISCNDKTLDPNYYQKIFGNSIPVLKLDDEHSIIAMTQFMPSIDQFIQEAFKN